MKAPCPPIPEICAGAPQACVGVVHLLCSRVEHCLPTFNSCLHIGFIPYFAVVSTSPACRVVLRQSKNCPVSFSANPCKRRAPTLAMVPLTTTLAFQSMRV